jgi:AraC family transcriptional regulator of adaptative response/methylated-DNA-[protein]-cysteine methyltransferase
MASLSGISPSHFQRVFSRWAGVSPKRFLQFLTLQDARRRLRASETVLQTAFATGLSGPSRLHGLLISTTAVTPGEYKTGGEGLVIHYGISPTPFGDALLASTRRGLCHLSFLTPGKGGAALALKTLMEDWPGAEFLPDESSARDLAHAIFAPVRKLGEPPTSLSLLLRGTNFQIQVWEALLRIPEGGLTTYGRLARFLGRPGGARAMGNALGRNPIGYLIPCHRVIREEGELGGYRWGLERKAALLGWEAARTHPDPRLLP